MSDEALKARELQPLREHLEELGEAALPAVREYLARLGLEATQPEPELKDIPGAYEAMLERRRRGEEPDFRANPIQLSLPVKPMEPEELQQALERYRQIVQEGQLFVLPPPPLRIIGTARTNPAPTEGAGIEVWGTTGGLR